MSVYRVLVACEYSGEVRDAFIRRGYAAVSCDIIPSESEGPHIQGNVIDCLCDGWDMMIAFPPCTHLCASGSRWWPAKVAEQADSLEFVRALMEAPIPKIAIENPVGRINTVIRRPDQIIQPWQFGHAEIKTTCLWLKGLPTLEPSDVVTSERVQRCWKMPPSATRGKDRSRTYRGIAEAMAAQWGPESSASQLNLFAPEDSPCISVRNTDTLSTWRNV